MAYDMNRSRMLQRPSRRTLLKALTSVGALGVVGCGGEPALTGTGPFPLGVASGEVTPYSALVWTRYDGVLPLQVVVWREQEEGRQVHSQLVTAREGGFVLLEVGDLEPGTRYAYAFHELGGARSRTGHFRTAIAFDALEPLRIGATSCTNYRRSMGTLEHAGSREDLDLFLMLGDAVYADGASTLAEFRLKWEHTLRVPGQQMVRAAHAMLATWDDHEFQNDWAGETLAADRFERASDAFFEHVPMRRLAEHPRRLWRRVRWGRTAEIFILDCRGERRPSTRRGPDAEYISPEQMRWLKGALQESTATFKLIMNSVPISNFEGALFQTTAHDRWEGYPAQRREILEHIDSQRIEGVLWVAGDFHMASMGRVSPSGPGSRQLEFLVGPGANFSNPAPSYPTLPQFDWASGVNNYAVLDLEPHGRTVEVTYHDATGRVVQQRRYSL
jgi:alkaline phosphatase D